MKKSCKIFLIITVISFLLSALYIPISAKCYYDKYYGLTCPVSYDKQFSLFVCDCWAGKLDRDAYSNVIQDSLCIPEEDLLAKDLQSRLDQESQLPEFELPTYILDRHSKIFFRVFKGEVLDRFRGEHDPKKSYYATPLNVHVMLRRCYEIEYDFLVWEKVITKRYPDGTTDIEEFEYTKGTSRARWDVIANGWSSYMTNDAFDHFMTNPAEVLTSAEITKQYADNIEIEYIFCFEDSQAAVIYCVTNYGDYIYYSPENTSSGDGFVFTVERFGDMLTELASRYSQYKNKTFDQSWAFITDDPLSVSEIIKYHEKDEILPYVVGGEEAVAELEIEDKDYGEYLHVNDLSQNSPEDTATQSIDVPQNTENISVDTQTGENKVDTFKKLFIIETVSIVTIMITALIVSCISKKRKGKKNISS